MTEAILIEIAQRFRRLEEAVEGADIFHAAKAEALEKRSDRIEADHSNGTIGYNTYCRQSAEVEKELDRLTDARESIEKYLELCREDMTAMQEEIRKAVLA